MKQVFADDKGNIVRKRFSTVGIISIASMASLLIGAAVYSMRSSGNGVNNAYKDIKTKDSQPKFQKQNTHSLRVKPKAFKAVVQYDKLPQKYAVYNCNGILKDEIEQSGEFCNADEYIKIRNLAQYYVQLVICDSKKDYEDKQQLRNRMWTLATQAFDEFVDIELKKKDEDNQMHTAHNVRAVIVRYLQRFCAITGLYKDKTEDTISLLNLEDIQQCIEEQRSKPFVALCVDTVFANFAYLALIEYKYDKEKAIQATADYVLSSLAHIAYMPCTPLLSHLRSIHHKATCLNKLAITNAAHDVLLQYSNKSHIAQKLDIFVGHLHALTHLCVPNYIAALFCHVASSENSPSAQEYINNLIQREQKEVKTVFQHITQLQKQIFDNQQSTDDVSAQLLHKCAQELSEKTISMVLVVDSKHTYITQAKQLYSRIQKLPKQYTRALSHKLSSNLIVPDTTGEVKDILKEANRLEYALHQLYIKQYDLKIELLHNSGIVSQESNKELRMHIAEYEPHDIQTIKDALTHPPKLRDKNSTAILTVVDMLDMEGRIQELYHSTPYYIALTSQLGDSAVLHTLTKITEQFRQYM